jgi:predicted nucleic acid-binding protein
VTRAFVADASVAIGWVHPGQATAEGAAMLSAIGEGAVIEVPDLWLLEVANALTVLVRRKKLTDDECQTALGWLRSLPLRVDHDISLLAFSVLSSAWHPNISSRSTMPPIWNSPSNESFF